MTNRADVIRAWAKRTVPALAFSATDEELEQLASMIEASTREQCAWECEMAGINGYGTLAAAVIIREGGSEWAKTDLSTSLCTT